MFSLWILISYYLRPIVKWFLRKTTGLCELQRICYGNIKGAPRTKGVEQSLMLSRTPKIKQLLVHMNNLSNNLDYRGDNEKGITNYAVNMVIIVKKINPRIHPQFIDNISTCIKHIWGYRQLLVEVEAMRRTIYDADNLEHERKLYDLWENLMPDEPLELRVTKQWQEIGFQGDDPKTDFRGMGLLGLENLLYFSTEYKAAACHVLSHSKHPTYGYAFAIVGINLTSMAWTLLKDGDAKTYFYNTCNDLPSLKHFHQFYSYLFYEFDQFWIECKPSNIMEFSSIRERFERNIRLQLSDPASVFKINLAVDTI